MGINGLLSKENNKSSLDILSVFTEKSLSDFSSQKILRKNTTNIIHEVNNIMGASMVWAFEVESG